jgi:hypothetical protein
MELPGLVPHMHCRVGEGPTTVSNQEDTDASWEERLEASRLEIQRLREENARLMESSNAFGQLAERLNTELQQERRLGEADRRRWARLGAPSRRASAASPQRRS